ncbi:hypothetical protein [Aliarcobacter butzleri]|uniref:hypothetical protein n=1 Tax=Aliarcobacter butzleri TaxID=28197 RepID=UPI00126A1FE0|nr:hypothetical protein [Aliarcobacter butzleri]
MAVDDLKKANEFLKDTLTSRSEEDLLTYKDDYEIKKENCSPTQPFPIGAFLYLYLFLVF